MEVDLHEVTRSLINSGIHANNLTQCWLNVGPLSMILAQH